MSAISEANDVSNVVQPTAQQWAIQALAYMRKITDLESTNAELTKRVAELEQKAYDLEMALGPYSAGALSSDLSDKLRDIACSQDNEFWDETFRSAAARIEFLQSQLAWTPVEKGLPTEPGLYEFATKRGLVYSWRVDADGCWQDEREDDFYDAPVCDMQPFVIYRRIELPKGGEL